MAEGQTAKQKLDAIKVYDGIIARKKEEAEAAQKEIDKMNKYYHYERLRLARNLANAKRTMERHREIYREKEVARRAKEDKQRAKHLVLLSATKEKLAKVQHDLETTRETLNAEYSVLLNRHAVLVDRIKRTVKVLSKALK